MACLRVLGLGFVCGGSGCCVCWRRRVVGRIDSRKSWRLEGTPRARPSNEVISADRSGSGAANRNQIEAPPKTQTKATVRNTFAGIPKLCGANNQLAWPVAYGAGVNFAAARGRSDVKGRSRRLSRGGTAISRTNRPHGSTPPPSRNDRGGGQADATRTHHPIRLVIRTSPSSRSASIECRG